MGLLAPVRAGTAAEQATGDAAFLQAMLDAEAALARALVRTGTAPASAAETITACARAENFDLGDVARRARSGGNPVIGLVADLRAAVRERDPDASRWVHHGATSQDILDTATMLVAARTLDLAIADVDHGAAGAARLARDYRDTVMAGRTLTQHAVPTTFGRVAAGWLAGLLDAADGLRTVRERLPAQLGGAAGTLAPLGAEGTAALEAYAAECGLACPDVPWHTLRSPVAGLAAALAQASGACGKVAADVASLTRTEIGEVAEEAGGGSSAMPHKRNPVRATMVLAAARQVPALASTLSESMVAEHERPAGAWHAEWQPLREALRTAGGAAVTTAQLLDSLRVDTGRMQANLDLTGGLLASERIVAALAPKLGRAEAGQRVRDLSLRAANERRPLRDLLAGDGEIAGLLGADALDELCDPAGYTGSAGAFADRVLARYRRTYPDREHP